MPEQTVTQDGWYYSEDGQSAGPVDTGSLRLMLRERKIAVDTPVWRAGMTDWVSASRVAELTAVISPPPQPTLTSAPQPMRCGPQSLSTKQKNRRIFFIIASGLAVISICLPWAYVIVPQGGFSSAGGIVIGAHFWQAVVAMILGLLALTATIVDLAMVRGAVIWQITKWCHLGLYIALTLIALLGVVLPIAESSNELGLSVYVIPLASILLLGVSVTALVLAILECRTPN